MKSCHKRFLTALLCIAALLSGAAESSPMELVRQELQAGGDLYLLFGPTALRRHISEVYLSLERGIAESSAPERDLHQTALTFLRMLDRLVGVSEIAALGVSSIRDAELGFSNRTVFVAGPGAAGWLWRAHGKPGPRLARIADLPADTVFAVDFGMDLRPLLEDLGETGGEKWLSRHFDQIPGLPTAKVMESISGDWQIALAIPEGEQWNSNNPPLDELKKCDVYVSVPDNCGTLKNAIRLLRSVNPAVKTLENVIYLPNGDGTSMVFVTLEHRILFFSSVRSFDKFCNGSANVGANGKFVPDAKPSVPNERRKTLAGEPGFAAAAKRLPANSHCAYFSTDARFSRTIVIGGKSGFQLALPNTVTRSVGVWLADDKMLVNRELSTEGLTTRAFDMMIGGPLLRLADLALRKRNKAVPAKKIAPSSKASHPGADVKRSVGGIDRLAECRKHLLDAKNFIDDYTKKHGKYPPKLPDTLKCGSAPYVYFAPFSEKPSGKIPLVADPVKGGGHPKMINVLFVDGSIGTFELEAGSVKRLCSFLYTIYRYDEKEFIRLIERASQLDAGKGK